MKKFISILLCLILMFSISVPAFSADEAEEHPTIYVTGAQTNNIISADGRVIYPISGDMMEKVKEALAPCLEELAFGYISGGDYSGFADTLNSYVKELYTEVTLDVNGEATDGSHPEYHSSTIAVDEKKSGYGMWDYRFWYDWRLSPVDTALELKNYIDRVTAATGKDKVQLVGRCYGANLIQAYITLYKDHAIENVSDVAYYASSVNGIDFMSALFSGEIVVDAQALTNFLDYYMEHEELIEDDALSAFVYALVELFNQVKVLGLGTEAIQGLFDAIKSDVLPTILPTIVGGWPSYWSMVVPELYEKSKNFIFGETMEERQKFIEKTDKFYKEVQLVAEDTILELQDKGINFYIFTKYGFPEFPLHEDALINSDSYTVVPRQSFGAECAEYGEVFSDDYLASLTDKTYLSPDFKVNAATALLPERSWFIKNLHHNYFEVLHDMTLEMMRYDMTVDNEKYPQYIYHENDKLSPMVGADEDATKAPSNPLISLMRFLTAFFNMIAKIFKGEFSFDFSSLFG